MNRRGPTGQSRESLLQDFVTWSAAHITGDETGQAQVFLDRLFQAFGQRGSLDVGGTAEMRIRQASEDGGGTSFADYVWKPVVLIEMTRQGTSREKNLESGRSLIHSPKNIKSNEPTNPVGLWPLRYPAPPALPSATIRS